MIKRVFITLLVVTTFSLPLIIFAKSQGYSSYLVLPSDSQVEGSTRSYDYSNHKISISIDRVKNNEPKYIVISLNKKKLIGSTQHTRKTLSYSSGSTLSAVMGNYGSGKKWYGFGSYKNALSNGNSGHGTAYAYLESDNVVMTSYN